MKSIKLFAGILFCLFITVANAEAHYFLKDSARTIEVERIAGDGFAVDAEGAVYVMGKREADDILFIRKYVEGKHIWSSFVSFGNLTIDGYDIRVCGQRVYVAGTITDEYRWQCWQAALEIENGKKVAERRLGDYFDARLSCLSTIHLGSQGEVVFALVTDGETEIEKYDQGHICMYQRYKYGEVEAITTDKNGIIYAAGEYENGDFFVVKYTNGIFIGGCVHQKSEYDQLTNIVVDDKGDVFCTIEPYFISCIVDDPENPFEGGEVECTPVWFYLIRLNNDLDMIRTKVVTTAGPLNHTPILTKLAASEMDIYTITSVSVLMSDLKTYYKIYVKAYNKEDLSFKHSFITGAYDYAISKSPKIYLRKNVQMENLSQPIDQLTLLVDIDFGNKTKILSFWIPKRVEKSIGYTKDWNMFSLPVDPEKDLYSSDIKGFDLIYGFRDGYYRVKPDEKLKVGVAYWGLATHAFMQLYEGTEILGIDVKQTGKWNMLGGCSYPFIYAPRFGNPQTAVAFGYSRERGYQRRTILKPGFGYWATFTSYLYSTTVDIHVVRP